jgi:excisionase family DNA binding protein
MDQDNRLMTVAEAAEYLHVSGRTLARWALEGRVPAIWTGSLWRFRKAALDAWCEQKETEARARGKGRRAHGTPGR